MKKFLLIVLIIICAFALIACGETKTDGNNNSVPKDSTESCTTTLNIINLPLSESRYEIVEAPIVNKQPVIIGSETDGTYNYYLLDIGYVKNMPVSSSPVAYYNGKSQLKLTLSKEDISETSVENSLSKTVEESFSENHENEARVDLTVGHELHGHSLELSVGYSRIWGYTNGSSNSTTNTYSTVNTIANSLSNSIEYEIGNNGEVAGDYRISLFATCDIYCYLTTSRDNSSLINCEAIICAREGSDSFALDYDTHGGDFGKTSSSEELTSIASYYNSLTIPELPEKVLSLNSEIITSTFSSYVWCEGSNLGYATFTVEGIKVEYEGDYYIYGNAWYYGKLGGDRFNDVASLYLKNASNDILIGGIFHWKGSDNDNNESGVAGWIKSSPGKNVSYLVEDPGKDFAANEDIAISITDICVKINEKTSNDYITPTIVTSTFETDFYCESTKIARLNFDVIGIKVKYDNSYYVMGNAYYSNNPNGQYFGDVADIYFKNSNKKILFGGTLIWQGSYDNNNQSGVATFNKNGGYNSSSIRYMMEDPGKDFAGNTNNKISISGICVQLEEIDSKDENSELTPSIKSSSFSTSVYCNRDNNLKNLGSAEFSVLGISVKLNGEDYLYGNAFHTGTLGGNRFNDVARLYLKDCSKRIELGGTLQWYGTNSDNNESGIAGFDKGLGNVDGIAYIQEDPGKDMSANKGTEISITGICVKE